MCFSTQTLRRKESEWSWQSLTHQALETRLTMRTGMLHLCRHYTDYLYGVMLTTLSFPTLVLVSDISCSVTQNLIHIPFSSFSAHVASSCHFMSVSFLFHSSLTFTQFVAFSWQPIMKFINDQYEAYLQEEININRKKRIPDSRVHCCIYFIPPTGHW